MRIRLGTFATICALLLSLAAVQGRAQTVTATAADLVLLCESANQIASTACAGLVANIIDVETLIGQRDPGRRTFCVLRPMPPAQARRVYLNWAKAQSDLAERDYLMSIRTALEQTYPCG